MFATKTECCQYVTDCLGKYAGDYDVYAIADECFEYDEDEQGFVVAVDEDTFWSIAAEYDLTEE